MTTITITMDADDPKLDAVLAAARGEAAPAEKKSTRTTKPKDEDEAPKETAAQKKKRLAAEKKAAEAKAAEAEEADEDDDGEKPPTREKVRDALKAYAKKHSKEAAEEIIRSTGASAISKIKEEHFADVLEACQKDPEDSDDDDEWD